ncbi:MAG: hypothetical protein RDV41_12130 [Planctomycetota bacterium]|nr:hypothetical protein [Planctomycetota bacterium]
MTESTFRIEGPALGPVLAIVAGCSVVLALSVSRPAPLSALDEPVGVMFDAVADTAGRQLAVPDACHSGSTVRPLCAVSCPQGMFRLVNLSSGWSFVLKGASEAQVVNTNALRLVTGEILLASRASCADGLSAEGRCLTVTLSCCIIRVSRGPVFVTALDGSVSVTTWGGEAVLYCPRGVETLSGSAHCEVSEDGAPVCLRPAPVENCRPVSVEDFGDAPRLEKCADTRPRTVGDRLELEAILCRGGLRCEGEAGSREFPILARIVPPDGQVVLVAGRIECMWADGGGANDYAASDQAYFPYVFRSRGVHAVWLIVPYEVRQPEGCASWCGITRSNRIELTAELPEVH